MGTTAQKLQKLVEGKQAIVNAVNSKANTSLSINSKLSDVANAISDITSGSSEIPEGYIKPSGNKEISSNGNYDITEYASVSVNVPTTGGSCEPTGLPLEVSELPNVTPPTAIPQTGYVDKIYVNTKMSTEEVVSLLDNIMGQLSNGENSLTLRTSLFVRTINNSELIFKDLRVSITWNANMSIYDNYYEIKYRSSVADIHYLFTCTIKDGVINGGWKEDFNGILEIQENATSGAGYESLIGNVTYGANNELVKDLFSVTPFPNDVPFNPDAFYKIAIPTSQAWFKVGTETINLIEFASQMGVIVILETVDSYPENPVEFGTGNEMVFYYVSSENDIYFYAAMDETGPQWLPFTLFAELMLEVPGLTFQGKVSSPDDFSGDGYYLLDGYSYKFYKYDADSFKEAIPGGIIPNGYLEITEENNFHSVDVTEYALVDVNVSNVYQRGTVKRITKNGEHNIATYETVEVDVPAGPPYEDTIPVVNIEQVRNYGYIHKVYVNTSMTPNEVIALYDRHIGAMSNPYNYENILFSYDESTQTFRKLLFSKTGFSSNYYNYTIEWYTSISNKEILFNAWSSNTPSSVDKGDFEGWNPKFNGALNVGASVVSSYEGMPIGVQNSSLIDLFYILQKNPGISYKEGSIYKTSGEGKYYIYKDGYLNEMKVF